ncbi:MAG: peroxiredoxin family protein [Acidimicrobiales bacterium]
MSQARTTREAGSARARRLAAEAAARRRRRWGFGGAGLAVLLIGGVVVGLHYTARSATPAGTAGAAIPATGQVAPPGTFTTLAGQNVNVSSLTGQPTLLWFVSTWCSSCQAGTQAMAQNLAGLRADGVRVDEVELYADLGQSGPSMGAFAKALAGSQYGNPAWTFGVSSPGLTRTYDPQSYLDIYYLLNAKGQVAYVNSSPGSTMPQLLGAAKRLA